jgi:hypothetical protein
MVLPLQIASGSCQLGPLGTCTLEVSGMHGTQKPNSFIIKEFGFHIEVGSGVCFVTVFKYLITSSTISS